MEDMKDEVVVEMLLYASFDLEYWETDKSADWLVLGLRLGLRLGFGFRFDLTNWIGFAKSRVVDCGWVLNFWGWTWDWDWDWDWEEQEEGARRKRAWPVRFNKLITVLNLETVKSVISVQSSLLSRSSWFEEQEDEVWEESTRISCSILFNPAEAASWIALCSSILIFEITTGSTTILKELEETLREKRK